MKSANYLPLLGLIAVTLVAGCGPTDEQVRQVVKVGSEIAALQRLYYPAITELGKVAIRIEDIGRLQDPAARAIASDIAKAHELIVEAFAAGQRMQDSFPVNRKLDVTEYILAEEASEVLLKEALDKTTDAVGKSRSVLDALAKANLAGRTHKK